MMRNRSASRMRSITSSLMRRSASVLRTRSRASAAIARERAGSSGTSGFAADDFATISDIATSLARDPEKWEPVFGKDHAQYKERERDGDAKKSHPALDGISSALHHAKARKPWTRS